MKKLKEATAALHAALAIRQEYAHLGLTKSYDMLQKLMNLTNMLMLSQKHRYGKTGAFRL